MSQAQFINITKQISDELTDEFLAAIYKRVVTNKFEVSNDEMEHIYDRIHFGAFDKQIGEVEKQ